MTVRERTAVIQIDHAVLADLGVDRTLARDYARASVLVRMLRKPIGVIEVGLPCDRYTLEAAVQNLVDKAPDAVLIPPRRRRAVTITVVVPTKNRPEQLRTLVKSLIDCSRPNLELELLLIDNASDTDYAAQVAKDFQHEGCVVMAVMERRVGASAARNRGLSCASGEIVAFVDDDCTVDSDWLAEMADGFANPAIDAVSGLVLPAELETEPQLLFEDYGGFSARRGFMPRYFDMVENRPRGLLFPWACGDLGSSNNLAYRTRVLRALGGFNERLGAGTLVMGGEDTELLRRTVLAGHTIAYWPGALSWHYHRREIRGLRKQIFGYGRGLTAALTTTLSSEPGYLVDFLRALPEGVQLAFKSNSGDNGNGPRYPYSLKLSELLGLCSGPIAYLFSSRASAPKPDLPE